MTGTTTTGTKGRITIERVFDAPIEDVWDLWTTKEGIESWWGPEGFRVDVHKIDLRPGGELLYAMIAVGAEQIAFMKQAGAPTTTEARITFKEIEPRERLRYLHLADFIPGVKPYDVETLVELEQTARGVRMALTFDAMHDDVWTQRQKMGWESEVGKLAKIIESRSRTTT